MWDSNRTLLIDGSGHGNRAESMETSALAPLFLGGNTGHTPQTHINYCDFASLMDAKTPIRLPEVVVSRLFDCAFDGVDIAKWLSEQNYTGRYCILAPQLANHDMVLQELRSVAPSLQIDLLTVPDAQP